MRWNLFHCQNLQAEYVPKMPNNTGHHNVNCERFAQNFCHGCDAVFPNAAGNDPVEMRKIGIDVEREAVHRDPARTFDSDGGDFARLRSVAFDPNACIAGKPLCRNLKIGKRANENFLDIAKIAVQIGAMRCLLEIKNRIADELPKAVIRNVAAAICL